jgi:hypothetical protein
MTGTRLELDRDRILAFRRRTAGLDERLPYGRRALRRAAWAGLQDSMPRAALLSINARVRDTAADTWADPSLVQLWGPGYSAYVVAERDRALFSLGRLPEGATQRRRAEDMAARIGDYLGDRTMSYRDVGRALGVNPNQLRYAAPTGTVLIRWEGAGKPSIWCVPRPDVDPEDARRALALRYLHVFGPATSVSFARWAGITKSMGASTFASLHGALTPVTTPIGEAWIFAGDEELIREPVVRPAPARLLPSGDTLYLLHSDDRELLVPDADHRDLLWTSRVWPGAILVGGEVAGTWRRSQHAMTLEPWRDLCPAERVAVEDEAESLPLPGVTRDIVVTWEG